MNETNCIHKAIAVIGLVASIALEHMLVGRRWARYEYTRRGMGICTVLAWAALLALNGAADMDTVLLLVGLLATAGGVLILMTTTEKARTSVQARAELDNGETRGRGTPIP